MNIFRLKSIYSVNFDQTWPTIWLRVATLHHQSKSILGQSTAQLLGGLLQKCQIHISICCKVLRFWIQSSFWQIQTIGGTGLAFRQSLLPAELHNWHLSLFNLAGATSCFKMLNPISSCISVAIYFKLPSLGNSEIAQLRQFWIIRSWIQEEDCYQLPQEAHTCIVIVFVFVFVFVFL